METEWTRSLMVAITFHSSEVPYSRCGSRGSAVIYFELFKFKGFQSVKYFILKYVLERIINISRCQQCFLMESSKGRGRSWLCLDWNDNTLNYTHYVCISDQSLAIICWYHVLIGAKRVDSDYAKRGYVNINWWYLKMIVINKYKKLIIFTW